ncbi:hypothetical protein TNCV_3829431 [Trichonephila clavipes]|nr:hypothetical protein TNCV_3829431 [Trichonephila clavipes]
MRDSSVRNALFHTAAHILLSFHYWRRRRLWFCVKGRPRNGRLADRPLCCKRRRMWPARSFGLDPPGLKDLQKGPISRIDLRKTIMKFEETGDLGVLPGRGQKPVGTETGEDVAAAVIERVSSSIPNGRSVSRELEIPWSTVELEALSITAVATSSDSFNPNRFPSSSGQPTQISSLFKFYDHLPQINS